MLHEKYPDVEAVEELVPLAMEIARLKLMGARRKSARRGEYARVAVDATGGEDPEEGALQVVSDQPDPEAQTEQRELVEQLEQAMEQLSGRCRELFRMKLEGLTFPEIRERLAVDCDQYDLHLGLSVPQAAEREVGAGCAEADGKGGSNVDGGAFQ